MLHSKAILTIAVTIFVVVATGEHTESISDELTFQEADSALLQKPAFVRYSHRWNAKGIKEYKDDDEDKLSRARNSLGHYVIDGNKVMPKRHKKEYVSTDAYVGPRGHYYLGGRRRRIGAGFGRRRRTRGPSSKWWATHKPSSWKQFKHHSMLKGVVRKPPKRSSPPTSGAHAAVKHTTKHTKHSFSKWVARTEVETPKYPAGFKDHRKSRFCHTDCMRLSLPKRLCSKCVVSVPIPRKGTPTSDRKRTPKRVGEYCCGCPNVHCLPPKPTKVATKANRKHTNAVKKALTMRKKAQALKKKAAALERASRKQKLALAKKRAKLKKEAVALKRAVNKRKKTYSSS